MAQPNNRRRKLSEKLAHNMANGTGRRRTARMSAYAMELGIDVGVDRYKASLMRDIKRNNLSTMGPSAGPRFLSSNSKTGIDPTLQSLLQVIHDRIIRT